MNALIANKQFGATAAVPRAAYSSGSRHFAKPLGWLYASGRQRSGQSKKPNAI